LGCLPSYCGNPGGKLWTNEAFIYNYDMANFYTKAVYDWDDSKLEDGMLTYTAPSVGIQYCGVGWAMAHPHTQLKLYQYYGDKRIIEQRLILSQKATRQISFYYAIQAVKIKMFTLKPAGFSKSNRIGCSSDAGTWLKTRR